MKAAPNPTSNGVPLARDLDGNAIPIPDGAVGWRVRRHTGGRPRLVLGVDKQPLRLLLDTTLADLDDMLGPGTYRLDLVDGVGNLAGVTVPVTIGQAPEPSNDEEPSPAMAPQTFMPPGGSDVRLVLEANIRAMQSTFTHHQKTLETSLRVVESLRDGVRVLADAQALWIRSLADTKTLVREGVLVGTRNAGSLPAGESAQDDDDDDSEDDEDERNAEAAPFWFRHIEPLLPMIPTLLTSLVSRGNGVRNAPPQTDDADDDTNNADDRLKLGDMLNWQRAYDKGKAQRARRAKLPPTASPADDPESRTDEPTPGDEEDPRAAKRSADGRQALELRRAVGVNGLLAALPAPLLSKLMLVRQGLDAEEERAAMTMLGGLTRDEVPGVVSELGPMSVEEITATLRALINRGSTPALPPSKASS